MNKLSQVSPSFCPTLFLRLLRQVWQESSLSFLNAKCYNCFHKNETSCAENKHWANSLFKQKLGTFRRHKFSIPSAFYFIG